MTLLLCILFLVIRIVVTLVALTALLSFTLAWYERANSDPVVIERRFTSRGISLACWLMLQEIASLLLTIVLRPFGWSKPGIQTDLVDKNPPVILLHGLFQNRSCMFWLQHRLKTAGFAHVYSINTPPWRDLETLTEILARKVDEIRLLLQVEQVHLVGHSMGGIIARNYIQNRGGAPRVARLVTIGSPHGGSKLAPFAVSPMGRSLLPGSSFMRQFNSIAWPDGPLATAIYSRHDNIVLPVANARMSGAQPVEVEGMGHTALLFHPRAANAVVAALAPARP